jgi:hypothetical protein
MQHVYFSPLRDNAATKCSRWATPLVAFSFLWPITPLFTYLLNFLYPNASCAGIGSGSVHLTSLRYLDSRGACSETSSGRFAFFLQRLRKGKLRWHAVVSNRCNREGGTTQVTVTYLFYFPLLTHTLWILEHLNINIIWDLIHMSSFTTHTYTSPLRS